MEGLLCPSGLAGYFSSSSWHCLHSELTALPSGSEAKKMVVIKAGASALKYTELVSAVKGRLDIEATCEVGCVASRLGRGEWFPKMYHGTKH